MKRLMTLALTAALFAPHVVAARTATPAADEAVFVEGTHYDAVLDGQGRRWRLLPAQGPDVKLRIADTCEPGATPPPGLWLLTRDGQGQPTLLAPSATALPAGHPGRVRLLDCGQAVTGPLPALAVPRVLLDWLSDNSGAVYVSR
ncbi:hypothetical protein [Arenimonas sp.]|uniref:hypothetical protein n=1 Tax=Arenimonas sp. TaxID=1872635 RepID=UPI0035B21FA9